VYIPVFKVYISCIILNNNKCTDGYCETNRVYYYYYYIIFQITPLSYYYRLYLEKIISQQCVSMIRMCDGRLLRYNDINRMTIPLVKRSLATRPGQCSSDPPTVVFYLYRYFYCLLKYYSWAEMPKK